MVLDEETKEMVTLEEYTERIKFRIRKQRTVVDHAPVEKQFQVLDVESQEMVTLEEFAARTKLRARKELAAEILGEKSASADASHSGEGKKRKAEDGGEGKVAEKKQCV
jgi:hypothetical protein